MTTRWGLHIRPLWIAVFTPILLGLLVGGMLGHPVFLAVFVIWLGVLACVLRAEAVHAQATQTRDPGQLAARAGWLLLAIVLIFGSAGLIRLVLG